MKALSLDLRQRIVKACQHGGATQKEVAERFSVGEATVERLMRLKRETGSLSPKPHAGGIAPCLGETDRADLLEAFKNNPDLTQQQIVDLYSAQGRTMTQPAVSRALRRLDITRKKRA